MNNLSIGFIGNFQVPYTTENDRAWSFEKIGCNVIKIQENETSYDQLIKIMDQVQVILYSHTHGWEVPRLKEFFAQCRQSGIKTASVHLDRWAWLARESDIGTEATWFTEHQFMADGSPEAQALYEKHGLNWEWLAPGVVERDCYIAEPDKQKFPHDIIFVGSRGYHPEYPFRSQLIDYLKQVYGDRFGHYGGDGIGGTIRGHSLNVLYSSAKVVVGDSCFGGRPYYWSDRVTETIGRGGFLIHPECGGLHIPGMGTYSGNFESVKKSVDYWLEHEEEREKRRLEAHEHVKLYETYTNRAQELLNLMFGG